MKKNLLTRLAIFSVACFYLTCLFEVTVQAQSIRITSVPTNFDLCKGGLVTFKVINSQTTAVAHPIITADFGVKLEDLSFQQHTAVAKNSSNVLLNIKDTTIGSKACYRIQQSIAAHDSISIEVTVRVKCNVFYNAIKSLPANTPVPNPATISGNAFQLKLYDGTTTGSALATLNTTYSISVYYPQVDVFTTFQNSLSHFTTVTGYGSSYTALTPSGYGLVNTPNTFYKCVRLRNLSSTTLDLSVANTFLKILENRDNSIQYKIKSIYLNNSGNTFTNYAVNTNAAIFRIGTGNNFGNDTIVLNGTMLQVAINKQQLATNDTVVFWEECELLPRDISSPLHAVNRNICNFQSQTNYHTAISCSCTACNGSPICFKSVADSVFNTVTFLSNAPNINSYSGFIRQDICYNYHDTANANFNQHTNRYYLILTNVGAGVATNLQLNIATRDVNPTTRYLMSKNILLANARIGIINTATTSLSSFNLPTTIRTISNLRFSYRKGTGVIPPSSISAAANGSIITIDSLIDQNGHAAYLKGNESLVLIWEGYTKIPTCGNVGDLETWQSNLSLYDSCNHTTIHFGATPDWSNSSEPIDYSQYANRPTYLPYITALVNGVSVSTNMQVAGGKQIIGNPSDDYSAAPAGRLKFSIPNFSSINLLPSNSNLQNQSFAVKIDIGELLNIWKGDIYISSNPVDTINPCGYADSSAFYEKNHLKKYVRFFTDTSKSGITPKYCRIYPTCIGYVNTAIGSYHHYDNAGRPTALNGITDEIVAQFKTANGFDINTLKNFYVEMDLQPACAHCPCAYQPYNSSNSSYIDSTHKKTGGMTPITVSVQHIPDETCGDDTFGVASVNNPPCTIPQNRYCLFSKSTSIVVQCPGCHIAGLYTIKALGSRINFGYEDAQNRSIADNPLKHLLFDQVAFQLPTSNPSTIIDVDKIMYHDLFRIRHKSIVHIDDSVYGNYYPLATTLNLPTSSSHPNEKGFSNGYLRVKTGSQIGLINYKNSTTPADLIHNIPSLIVWVMDGDSLQTAGSSYVSGFNAFRQNTLYAQQTYTNGATTYAVTPISLFYDVTRDFRDTANNEYVYDFSWDRLNTAYKAQYSTSNDLPFRYFHNGMRLSFDVTYSLNNNVGIGNVVDDDIVISSKAYFTFAKETQANCSKFFDMQDAADQPLTTGASGSPFVATATMLKKLCPMPSSPYTVNVNGVVHYSCDSIRWYCVKGVTTFTSIGYNYTAATFQPNLSFCSLEINNFLNGNDYRHFLIGKSSISGSGSLIPSTQFNNEFRRWCKGVQLSVSGLPTGSKINTFRLKEYSTATPVYDKNILATGKKISMNGGNNWVLNFDSLNAKKAFYTAANLDSIPQGDDNEMLGSSFNVLLPNCLNTNYNIPIQAIDESFLPNWDSIFLQNKINALPFATNYQPYSQKIITTQNVQVQDSVSNYLTGTGNQATLADGVVCWSGTSGINLIQSNLSGDNTWLTLQFPPSWQDSINTVTSITINGKSVPIFNQTINGVATPKFLGNHTWLFFAPDVPLNCANHAPTNNAVAICAKYNCGHAPSDTDVVLLHAGIICDTTLFASINDTAALYTASCERTLQPLSLTSKRAQLNVNDLTDYSQAGLCKDFDMKYSFVNTGAACIHQLRMRVDLPTGSGMQIITATGASNFYNAVLLYHGNKHYFHLANGVRTPLDSLISSSCGNEKGALSANGDSCVVIYKVRSSCQPVYQPVTDSFWGLGKCAQTYINIASPIVRTGYPTLSGNSNKFNQLQPQFSFTTPFNTNCKLPDSIHLALTAAGGNATNILQSNNRVLLKLPKGLHLNTINALGQNVPLKNYSQFNSCKATALSLCNTPADTVRLYEADLSVLGAASLLIYNPLVLTLNIHADSTIACIDSVQAVVVTVGQATCTTPNTTCNFCMIQTNPDNVHTTIIPPATTLNLTNVACSGKATVIANSSCNHYKWKVNNSWSNNFSDTLKITQAGTYNIIAASSLFARGGSCTSSLDTLAAFAVTAPVTFHDTFTTAKCDSANGFIKISAVQGVKPFLYELLNNGVVITTSNKIAATNFTFKNLAAGTYKVRVTDSVNCSHTDSLTLPVQGICGANYLCTGTSQLFSISPIVDAATYHWYKLSGTTIVDSAQAGDYYNCTFNSVGTFVIKVVVKNATGVAIFTKTLNVTLHAIPTQPIISLLTGSIGCKKYDIVLQDTCWVFCNANLIYFITPKVAGYIKHTWSALGGTVISGLHEDTVAVMFWKPNSVGFIKLEAEDTLTHCNRDREHCISIIQKPDARIVTHPRSYNKQLQVCLNQQIILFDSSNLLNGNYTYYWFDGNGRTLVANNSFSNFGISYNHAGTYHAGLIIENTCHCTDTAWLTINVDTIKGADIFCKTPVCYGDSAVYSTSVVGCGTYNWVVKGGTIIKPIPYSSAHTIQVVWNGTPQNNGGGEVSLSVNNCAGFICNSTSYLQIPFLKNHDTIRGTAVVCPNSLATYTVPSIAGATYTWLINGTYHYVSGGSSNALTMFVQIGDKFDLQVITNHCTLGCIDTSLIFHVVSSNNSPTILSLSGNVSTVCLSDTTTLTTNHPSSVFRWYMYVASTNHIIDSTTTSTAQYKIIWDRIFHGINGNAPVIIQSKDLSGAYCNSGNYFITVLPPPDTLSKSSIGQYDSCICRNSSINLHAQADPANYLIWQVVSPTTATNPTKGKGNTFTTHISGNASAVYTIAVTQVGFVGGCKSAPVKIKVATCQPPAGGIHGDSMVCINSFSTLKAPLGFDSYSWQITDNSQGTIKTGQGTNQIGIQWNAPAGGAYNTSPNIKLDAKYCSSNYTTFYTVNIDTPPSHLFIHTAVKICAGNSSTITVTAPLTNGCNLSGKFYWNFGDGVTDSSYAASMTHTYATAGSYTITVVARNSSTFQKLIKDTLLIQVQPAVTLAATYTTSAINANLVKLGTSPYTYTVKYGTTTKCSSAAISNTSFSCSYASTDSGSFVIKVVDVNGCFAEQKVCPLCLPNHGGGGNSSNAGCPNYFSGKLWVQSIDTCTGKVTFKYSYNKTIHTAKGKVNKLYFGFNDNTSAIIRTTDSNRTGFTIIHQYNYAGNFTPYFQVIFDSTCNNGYDTNVLVKFVPHTANLFTCSGAATGKINVRIKDISDALAPFTVGTWTNASQISSTEAQKTNTNFNTFYTITYHAKGCTITDTFTTPVAPQAAYTTDLAAPVCELTTVQFKDASTPAKNIIGWDWKWNDKTSATPVYPILCNLQNPYEAFNFDAQANPNAGYVKILYQITDKNLCTATVAGNYYVRQNTLPPGTNSPTNGVKLNLLSTQCEGAMDTIFLQMFPLSANVHPRFTYEIYQGFAGAKPLQWIKSYLHQNKPAYFTIGTTGCYYIKTTDSFGCSALSYDAVFPYFNPTPDATISGVNQICADDAADFKVYNNGTSSHYHWSISPALTGSTPDTFPTLHIPKGLLHYRAGGYKIMVSVSNSTCTAFDTMVVSTFGLPTAVSITSNNQYCIRKLTDTAVLVATFTGGTLPYNYSWGGGNTYIAHLPGIYGVSVSDSNGCNSNILNIAVNPPPDVSGVVSGCFMVCDTALICKPSQWAASQCHWLVDSVGSAVNIPANQIASSGNLRTWVSGSYHLKICDANSCCSVSDPIDLDIKNCTLCCLNDTAYIDSLYCIGIVGSDSLFHFTMQLKNNCPHSIDSMGMTDQYGNNVVTLLQTTALHGWTTIEGTVLATNGATVFAPQLWKYRYNQLTAQYDLICDVYTLPVVAIPHCVPPTICTNTIFSLNTTSCSHPNNNHYTAPQYHIILDVSSVNGAKIVAFNTANTVQLLTSLTGTIIHSGNSSISFNLQDVLPYDQTVCIDFTLYDSTTNDNCVQRICIPLNLCQDTTQCYISSAFWNYSTQYVGTDIFGNNQYNILFGYQNPKTYTQGLVLSLLSPDGYVTAITPPSPTLTLGNGANLFSVLFTHTNSNGKPCFRFILTDTSQGKNDFCTSGLVCVYAARIGKSQVAKDSSAATCMLKVVPNPNNGKPQIYYKLVANNEESNTDLSLTLSIVESSSGKTVFKKLLPNAAGILVWDSAEPLPDGHYIVLLSTANKLQCSVKMEVIK